MSDELPLSLHRRIIRLWAKSTASLKTNPRSGCSHNRAHITTHVRS